MSNHERTVRRWGLLVLGGHGPIIAGDEGGVMRTSTPLVEFDHEKLTGTTASGRPYRLLGEPDRANAVRCVLSLWDIGDTRIEALMPEEASSRASSNRPFEFSAAEARDLAVRKMTYCAQGIRREMILLGLDEEEASASLGLAPGKLEAILSANPDGATADEADDALVALVRAGTRHGR